MKNLGIGTSIVTRAGPALVVKSLISRTIKGGVNVYNFTVDGDHTYFVGIANGGAWVHNECVSLDTNAIVALIEGPTEAKAAAFVALNGRTPVVSITAAKEFLKRGSSAELRRFLVTHGGRIGAAGDEQAVAALIALGLRSKDAQVAGSAIKEGTKLLTRDVRLIRKIPHVGENF